VGPLAGLGLAHRGLALATSVTSLANLALLALWLRRRLGGVDGARVLGSLARIAAAGAVAAGIALWALGALADASGEPVPVRAAVVAAGGLAWLALHLVLLRLFHVEELAMVADAARAVRDRFRAR
jgi:putative peptidoglycan lipid II flippase